MNELEVMSIESEAGFRALFEYATIGIVVISREGRIELANPCVQKMFGYENAELIGQPVEVLIPKSLGRKHVAHREGYFDRPKARPMGLGMELYARKKDGQEFPVEISLGHYELNGETFAVAFVTDITQRSEAEQKLKKMNEELESRVQERTLELTESLAREKELGEMKSRFVSMASHEFRTPLSAILSSAALIDRFTVKEEEEKRKKHIERIKSSVQNLTDILNDFLSLDKLEQGKVEVETVNVDMREFVDDILEEMQGMLKEGQRITYVQQGENEIFQDRKILRNVLLNLLSNAVKYSEVNQEIILATSVDESEVSISVKDEGIGIPEEEHQHLFTKFFRAKNAINIKGTGLGLTIVKRYVELMNGTIGFTSNVNKGTTFIVKFPNQKTK